MEERRLKVGRRTLIVKHIPIGGDAAEKVENLIMKEYTRKKEK